MMTSNLIQADQRREDFIENILIVYFSEECCDHHIIDKLQNIANVVYNFSDLNECVNFITTITSGKVFFVCSSDYQYCLPLIYQLPSIDSMYTFQSPSTSESELHVDDCSKFRGLFNNIDRLCEEIQMNIRRSAHLLIGFQTINSTPVDRDPTNRDTDKQDALFMYAQLLKEILLLSQSNSEEAKHEMIEYCQQCFIGNTRQLQFIDEFQTNSNNHSPIWFYTSESFLYRMLNSALRVQDVKILYKLRYFIKQLHEQIVQLNCSQQEHQPPSNIEKNTTYVMLYRGQAMMSEEFAKLQSNIGGLLSISNFLSTSRKESVGRFFADMTLANPDVISVCMNIRANATFKTQMSGMTPFAYINEISRFGEMEDEVLLSMGSVFRIEKIEQSLNGLWLVSLMLTGDEDQQLRLVRESLKTRIECDEPLLSLGKLMYAKGDYQKAIEFFEQLLNDETFLSYLPNRSVLHNELAQIYKQIGHYTKAQQFYEIALVIARQHPTGKFDHHYVAGILNNQGMVHLTQKNYTRALEYFEQALHSCEAHPTPHREHMSIYLNNIGLVQHRLGNVEQSLIFYGKSLQIKREILPTNHPAIANTLCNIGDICAQQGKYEQALDLYEEALRVEKATLPPHHPSMALTHAHIGEILAAMGRFHDAIKAIEMAITIDSMTLSADNAQLVCHRGRLDRVKNLLKKQSGQ